MKRVPASAAIAVAVAAQLSLGRVARADEAPSPPNAPAPYPAPTVPAAAWPAPFAVVHADNPRARLQVQTWGGWQDVCPAPCGVAVDAAALYRIAGSAIVTSEPFQLPRSTGTVTIDAKTGSKTKRWVGLGMLVGGGAAAFLGAVFYEAASNLGPDLDGSYSTRNADRVYSAGVLLTGVAVSIIGVVFLQSRTAVDVRGGA
jgi:hypothetical protein